MDVLSALTGRVGRLAGGSRPGLLLWLTLVSLSVDPAAAAPHRVVSQTVGTDELLLAVADPGQIAALSHLARDPDFSAVAEEARPYPILKANGDAEDILQYAPTLTLVADYSRDELVEQIRRTGVEVMVFDRYDTLEDTYANLTRLATALGTPERAEALVAACRQRVRLLTDRLAGAEPVRVIAPSTYGVIAGSGTTFQDLCDHSGAENLAATLGGLVGHVAPPVERMLTWPIDFIVVTGETPDEALGPYRELSPYALMSVVRKGRAVVLKPWHLGCVSHHRIEAYEHLARALHPRRFSP
jgi:iron complex transport system substrate-binding protein